MASQSKRWRAVGIDVAADGRESRDVDLWSTDRQGVLDTIQGMLQADPSFDRVVIEEQAVTYGEITVHEV